MRREQFRKGEVAALGAGRPGRATVHSNVRWLGPWQLMGEVSTEAPLDGWRREMKVRELQSSDICFELFEAIPP